MKWSCLMDGEADDDAVGACLREWSASEAARADWALWHAAGDAMRSSEVASWHSERFSGRMSQALASEAPIVAPRLRNRRLMRRVVLPGAAVAAAAAMLAVVALPVLRGQGTAPVELAQRAPLQQLAAEPAAVARVEPPPQMDLYIAAHREMTGVVGMPRTTPYLRTTTVLPER